MKHTCFSRVSNSVRSLCTVAVTLEAIFIASGGAIIFRATTGTRRLLRAFDSEIPCLPPLTS